MEHRETHAAGFRRVAALACAAAYLVSGTETLPQLLALGASLEGSHTVYVGRSQTQIIAVLSHERSVPERPGYNPQRQVGSRLHRHGGAVSIFCLFDGRGARNADHVVTFPASSACVSPAGASKAKVRALLWMVPAGPTVLTHIADAPAALNRVRDTLAAPRPADFLELLRSTVLVV